jgi:hypothetical protein
VHPEDGNCNDETLNNSKFSTPLTPKNLSFYTEREPRKLEIKQEQQHVQTEVTLTMAVSTENLLITVVITTIMSVQTKGSVSAIMTEITIALFSEQQRSITVLLFMTMG